MRLKLQPDTDIRDQVGTTNAGRNRQSRKHCKQFRTGIRDGQLMKSLGKLK
jgi:hypothetical protein